MSSRPSPALQDLARSLAEIRPFSGVVLAIRQIAADPRKGIGDIARLVERDVGISTNLLRVANAPTSGLAQQCSSVRHALTLLGLKRVCDVVTSAAALEVLAAAHRGAPDAAMHSIAVAGVARLLAPIIGVSPDEAFTAGLLHDIGSLLLLQSGDVFYEGLVEQYGTNEEPSVADEEALLGYDHAALGAQVLKHWNLPAPLPQIVGLHHDWERAQEVGGAVCMTVALIRVADVLARTLPQTAEPSLEELRSIAADPALVYIGLNSDELFKLWEGLRRACDKAAYVAEPAPSPTRSDVHAPPAPPAAPVERVVAPPTKSLIDMGAGPRVAAWWIGAAALAIGAAGLSALLLY